MLHLIVSHFFVYCNYIFQRQRQVTLRSVWKISSQYRAIIYTRFKLFDSLFEESVSTYSLAYLPSLSCIGQALYHVSITVPANQN